LAKIVEDGKLEYVIGANNGIIRALNVENGTVLWTVNNPNQQAFFLISIADVNNNDTLDVIYHRTTGIQLLNASNGKVEWTYPIAIGGAFRGSVVTDLNGNGKLDLVPSHYTSKVEAVELFTGSLWTFNTLPILLVIPRQFLKLRVITRHLWPILTVMAGSMCFSSWVTAGIL